MSAEKKHTTGGAAAAILLLLLSVPGTQVLAQSLLTNLEKEIATLVERAKPAVVTILAYIPEEQTSEPDNSFLPFLSGKGAGGDPDHLIINVGTGIYLHREGFIATRSSVIAQACSVRARFYTGEEVKAEILGVDEQMGVGLLRVPAMEIAPVPFGHPDHLLPGSWILVIGNSLGVSPAVSLGNVNAIRDNGLIQINASIDPGNNGSPVLNATGEIIGMVSGRIDYRPSPGRSMLTSTNTALVLPITHIYDAAKTILQRYSDSHGWLGMTVMPDPDDIVHPIISKLEPGSPAEKAGLQVGDKILAFGNQELEHYYSLLGMVKKTRPGEKTTIRIRRNQDILELPIVIGKMDYAALLGELQFAPRNITRLELAPKPASRNLMLERRILEMERQLKELRAKIIK